MVVRAGLRSLPNLISLSRVALAAGFVAAPTPNARLTIVALAAVTDFLDGWVARRGNWTSGAGALMDPIADRVFVLVAVSTFLFIGALSTAEYFVLILRDLMTAVGFLVARSVSWLRPVQFKARGAGKAVTSLQLLTFVALLRQPLLVTPLIWGVGVMSVYAVVDYTVALSRARAT
jgi:CDP-diacylglycerol--glycerol-3-phosphate 3-phosphatidyltransferase/cardiolipin synthase